MDRLGLLFLGCLCVASGRAQVPGTNDQNLNALLRGRQGFPGQVERAFFMPQDQVQGGATDQRQDRRGMDPSGPGMFTVDKHVEVPSDSFAATRGSRKWQMDGSQSRRVEATRDRQLDASGRGMVGTQSGTLGGVNQGQQGGIVHGHLDTANQAQLDASGQTDITVEGEALVPTRLLSGGGQGMVGSQGGMIDRMDRRNQGEMARRQLDVSRQAQLEATGQRDVSAQVQKQGISGGSAQPGVDTLGGGTLEGGKQGELGVSSKTGVDNIGQGQISTFDQGQQGTVGQGQIEASNQAQLSAGGQGEVTIEGEVQVPTRVLDAARRAQSGIPGEGQIGSGVHVGTSREGQIGTTREANLGTSNQGLLDLSGGAQKDVPRERQLGMSREGQLTRDQQLDLSREGHLGLSRETQLDASRGGQLTASRDTLLGGTSGGGTGFSREGQIGASREGELGLSHERRLDLSRDGQLSLSRETQIDASRGGQFAASKDSQLGGTPEGQMGLSREGQIDASRGGQLSLSREQQLDLTRGGQLELSRKAELDASRGGQFSASRDRQIDGVGGGQAGLSREGQIDASREGQLSLSREQQLGASRQGQFGALAEGSFGASRERQLDASRAGQLSMTRDGQFGLSGQGQGQGQGQRQWNGINQGGIGSFRQGQISASNQADLRARGQGEVTVEGEIAVPSQALNAASQLQNGALRGDQVEIAGDRRLHASGLQQTDLTGKRGIVGTWGGQSVGGQPDFSGQGQGVSMRGRQLDFTGHGQVNDLRQGQIGTVGQGPLSGPTSRQLDLTGGFDRSQQGAGSMTPGGLGTLGQGQISTSNQGQLDMSGKGEVQIEGEIQVPTGLGGGQGAGIQGTGQSREPFFLDLSGRGQNQGQNIRRDQFAGNQQGGASVVDLSGTMDKFPGKETFGQGQKIGRGDIFQFSRVAVNIRCYADPIKGLSCGVEYPDDRCKEKWDFPDPCTRENMDKSITKFVHPYDHSKFLMCGEMGKLYIVQCPQHEIFHAVCGQCVHKTMELTTSCQEPLTPQVANPCTEQNIIENKLYFPYPGNLAKYIHCDNWGKAWARVCTPGNVWNKWDKACVIPTILNPCSRLNADLAYIYPHPCNPRRYLRCDNYGDAYEEYCDAGKAFNEAKQDCDLIGSFIGSDQPEFCENRIFGFKPGRPRGGIDRGLGQDRGRLDRIGSTGQRPGSVGVNGKAGSLVLHESKARTYKFIENTPYVEPCTAQNIKEGRYHFRVEGDPYSYIQCDQSGKSYLMPCPGDRTDSFDPWTNTCVDGLVHVDNIING